MPRTVWIRNAVSDVQAQIRAEADDKGIRWETSEKFHFTLKFLGETPDEQLTLLKEAAVSSAASFTPFELTLAGLGAFPRQRSPQVLWVGAKEGVPVLIRLAEYLDKSLALRGFPPERRRFHPHLTLARAKTREGEEALAKTLGNLSESVDKIGTLRVDSFILMRSELRPAGSVYTVLQTFTLGKAGSRG